MAHGSPRCGVTCLASPSFASPSAPLAPGYRKAKRTGYRFANLVRTDWSTRRDHFHTTSGFSFCLLLLLLLALQDPARCVLFCAWVRLMKPPGRKGCCFLSFFFAGLAGSVRDTVPDPAGPEVPVEPHKGITGALSFRVYGRATFRTGVGEKRLSCGFSSLEISAKFANRIRETHPAVTQGCGSTILKKGYALWLESSMVVEHC